MEQSLITALRQLDCTPKEVRLYLACFTLGPSKIIDIAKQAKLQRSTAYLLCEQLIEKQLLVDDNSAYAKRLIAATPETVIRLLDTKRRRIARSSLTLTDNLIELQQMYGSSDIIPRITTYHGATGLRTARSHILAASTELLLWTNQESEQAIFSRSEHDSFVLERISKSLNVRVLAVGNMSGRSLLDDEATSLRTTKILPLGTTFSAETYVFDSKVVILDYTADVVAIIIENSSVATAQRAMFELAWSQID